MKVKICGIRSMESAKAVLVSGADFLGFIFVPSSRRYLKPEDAKLIIDSVRKDIKIVGVFKNESLDEVNRISEFLGLDYVQLHGDESSEFCRQVKTKVIKAFPLHSSFDISRTSEKMKKYNVEYYLLDRENQGEGEMLDVQKAKEIAKEFPVIMAGGLTPTNVSAVISEVSPAGVDVVSGVETDGIEDIAKIKMFIKKAKGGVV